MESPSAHHPPGPSDGDGGSDVEPEPPRGLSLRRLSRAWPRAVVGIWLVLNIVLALQAISQEGVQPAGDVQGLLPNEHRSRSGEPWILLALDESDEGSQEEVSSDTLVAAATLVGQKLGDERVPLAPPGSEVAAWLDSNALYLLPVSAHGELQKRLSDDQMAAAVQGLRARLTSPLFGAGGEDPRRDPLDLRQLAQSSAGELGHVRAADVQRGAAEVTAAGDLMAADGRALLIQVRSQRELEAIADDVETAVRGYAIVVSVVGPEGEELAAKQTVDQRWQELALATLAGLTIVLALSLRRVRPVLAVLVCLVSGVSTLVVFKQWFTMLSLPFVAIMLGFGCEGALRLQRISQRGWPAAAVLGTALLPLLLSPYPEWKSWCWFWLGGFAIVMVNLRVVLPALLRLVRGSVSWPMRGFVLSPMPVLALLLSSSVLAGGAWATTNLHYRGADRIPLGHTELAHARTLLVEGFFDPRLAAEVASHGDDDAAALELAALHARELADLVPTQASRLDSPGSFVITQADLKARRDSLIEMNLPERMRKLHDILESRGLRGDAFGEFLRGAADLDQIPSPRAALDGPLGPWIERYVDRGEDGSTVRAQVHLRPDPEAPVPAPVDADGQPLELRGPVVAARQDRETFGDWLGIYTLSALWLGSLFVWLGTASLAIAISAAFAALTTQCGLLLVMLLLQQPVGPHMIPVFLLVGAAGLVAGARSCRSVDLQRPIVAVGLLVTSLCQVAAGLTLVATGEPLWTQMGLPLAIGCALASGVGLFVAPGFCSLLRRLAGRKGPSE